MPPPGRARAGCAVLLLGVLVLGGCRSMYFEPAAPGPAGNPRYALEAWPWDEYWTGIVFNGAKIGFTHLAVRREPGHPPRYRIDSEAALHLRFLGFDKQVQLRARDWVADDLTLVGFEYDYRLDQSRLRLHGEVDASVLHVRIENAGEERIQRLDLTGPTYPASVIAMYPVLRGLEVGVRHVFTVYDGETQSLAPVRQHIEALETSTLFAGAAFRLRTRMHGKTVETWIDARGLPVLEMTLNGVLIAELESEARARTYLASAALSKREVLLDLSRVEANRPLAAPRDLERLTLRLHGIPADFPLPAPSAHQDCRREGEAWWCDIRRRGGVAPSDPAVPADLIATLSAPSDDPRIARLASAIAGSGTAHGREAVVRLVDWLQSNIEKTPADSYSALDVLRTREAECQGHSYLYAAMARALAIPTRVVNGLVYSEALDGFLYHTWVESLVDGEWLPVDPTFGQVGVDATHVRLLPGEDLAALAPLSALLGRLRAEIVAVEPTP